MTEIELDLLMKNLESAHLAQIAKDDLNKLFEEVKKRSMEAILSNDSHMKDAVILANMTLIGKMVHQQLLLIDQTQKTTMDISGVIAKFARQLEENDLNSQEEM